MFAKVKDEFDAFIASGERSTIEVLAWVQGKLATPTPTEETAKVASTGGLDIVDVIIAAEVLSVLNEGTAQADEAPTEEVNGEEVVNPADEWDAPVADSSTSDDFGGSDNSGSIE